MKLNYKQFVVLNIIILLIGIVFAFSIIKSNPSSHSSHILQGVNFGKILIQNILFAIAILLGAFTFNILTFCLCLYNGLVFGMYLKSSIINLGVGKTTLIFLPHLIFEILWLILCLNVSFIIYTDFKKYVYNSNRLTRFGFKILTLKYKLLAILSIVVLGCVVEYFITFKIFAK